jgi:phospholipase/carboxylesterase
MPSPGSPSPFDPSDPHAGRPIGRAGAALGDADAAVVLVHGRGADARDILGLAGELAPEGAAGRLAFLAPDAAEGTWYPYSFLSPIERNEPWLSSALAFVGRVTAEIEAAGIPSGRTVLAGFSQGACLATEYAARNPRRYGAVIAFTGGLIGPPGSSFGHAGDLAGTLAGTPAYLGAGDPDPHVPWRRVEETAEVLRRLGAEVETERFPGLPHTIARAEILKARAMVAAVVGA